MFSGSVARGVRQLTSQMNDHHRVQGNLIVGQDSAYDLLSCLFIPLLKEVFAILAKIIGKERFYLLCASLKGMRFRSKRYL